MYIYMYIYIYIYMITHIYVTLYIIVTIKLLSGRLSLYAQAIIGTKIYAYTIYRLAMKYSDKRRKKKT